MNNKKLFLLLAFISLLKQVESQNIELINAIDINRDHIPFTVVGENYIYVFSKASWSSEFWYLGIYTNDFENSQFVSETEYREDVINVKSQPIYYKNKLYLVSSYSLNISKLNEIVRGNSPN